MTLGQRSRSLWLHIHFWVITKFCDSMFSSMSVKKIFFEKPRNLCFFNPCNHFTKRRLADKTLLTWKISIPNNFLTVWPIHFIFGKMVKQLHEFYWYCWPLTLCHWNFPATNQWCTFTDSSADDLAGRSNFRKNRQKNKELVISRRLFHLQTSYLRRIQWPNCRWPNS